MSHSHKAKNPICGWWYSFVQIVNVDNAGISYDTSPTSRLSPRTQWNVNHVVRGIVTVIQKRIKL